jgi:phosphopantetheinyl transferase
MSGRGCGNQVLEDSQIVRSENRAISLPHPPFFKDHHVNGKPVLPAVEAMESLAASVSATFPDTDTSDITTAVFDKFLFLNTREKSTPVHNRLDKLKNGAVKAALLTKSRAPKAQITRTKIHAAMSFGLPGKQEPALPLDIASALNGICRTVEPERLYAELVPFGHAYRNIVKTLYLADDGALARVGSPRPRDERRHLVLGSPYPLDAAFHAACAWAQYAKKIVAFPVAVDRIKIVRPTSLDETYVARIIPVKVDGETLVYDIFIFDLEGTLREVASGVQMRDISGGLTSPPEWIQKRRGENLLANIARSDHKLAIIERRSVAPFACETLSKDEQQRYLPMAADRKNSFLAARLALKRISRELSGGDRRIPPGDINTVRPGSPKPFCPVAGGSQQPFCSVSHDNRFAIAVAADNPVGIDVEQITARALKNRRLFMHKPEEELTKHFSKGEVEAAVRIWSAKEAAAKALDMPLARAWDRVALTAIGLNESQLHVKDRGAFTVSHDTVDSHLFTLFNQQADD